MGLISFSELLRNPPKDKVFIVDTSFIILSSIKDTDEYKVRRKLAGKCGFVYNVVIRKEVLHLLRKQMVIDAIDESKFDFNRNIKWIAANKDEHEVLKTLCDEGYAEMFREIFGAQGEKLQKQKDIILTGCTYADGAKNSSSWTGVLALMSMYGLDSSDAMILNFAVGDATYGGIITSDKDFRVCGDVTSKNGFDVILPDAAKKRIACKDWRLKSN